MKKLLLILNLFAITAFGQSIQGTNTLLSKSNISYQLNYELKPRGAFTNTIRVETPTNTPAIRIWFSDNTNEAISIIATNNALYITGSNSVFSLVKYLIIQYTNGVPMLWNDNAVNGNGNTPLLGNISTPWQLYGTNVILKGASYGFFSPTNITVTAINVSANDGGSPISFVNPTVNSPGMYEVGCTVVVTQACVGAIMYPGVVASNAFGFTTNYLLVGGCPLTALTNMSGSIITSNVNFSLSYNTMIKSYSSGTALGYINWFVRQLQ